jgi:ribosomal protein S18 acetylase RimI-like enzyme
MKIELERIRSADHKYFPDLFNLYQESFPREERREWNALVAVLNEKAICFSAVTCGTGVFGLVVFWEFDGFIYIEHLAVKPDHRGKGIAGSVLGILHGIGKPILLEVEIPFDEASSRRVAFYNRCGFTALPCDYFQPPYREGELLLPMMLFSNQSEWEPEMLAGFIDLFQSEVYYSRQKG